MDELFARKRILHVLSTLNRKKKRSDKVVLHKFLFFLAYQGIGTGLTFEPYTYGPFSFDLATHVGAMSMNGKITLDGGNYVTTIEPDDQDLTTKIEQQLELFEKVVGDFSFRTLECVGTLLYCQMVIKKSGDQTDDVSIIEEFKGWKGSKFSNEEINKYLASLHHNQIM